MLIFLYDLIQKIYKSLLISMHSKGAHAALQLRGVDQSDLLRSYINRFNQLH